MMTDEARLLMLIIWGGGTVTTYGISLARDVRDWRIRRDVRSRRELLESFGLFLAALTASLSIAVVLFAPAGTGIRGMLVATALGAFMAAGVVRVVERKDPIPVIHDVDPEEWDPRVPS